MTFRQNLIYYTIKQNESITLSELSESLLMDEKSIKDEIHSMIQKGHDIGLQRESAYIHQENDRIQDWLKMAAIGLIPVVVATALKVGGIA